MKLIVKYMSPLIFGGLIIACYTTSSARTCKSATDLQTTIPQMAEKPAVINSFFYEDVVKNIFPALKILN
jgi:hypothetical protein